MTAQDAPERYSYRQASPDFAIPAAGPETSLEQQIQIHLLRGDAAYASGRYADALSAYSAAWARLPEFVAPAPGAHLPALSESELLRLDLTDALVSASVQLLRLRDGAGPRAPIIAALTPAQAPYGVAGLDQQQGSLSSGEQAYALSLAHARSGEYRLAQAFVARAVRETHALPRAQADAHLLAGAIAVAAGDRPGGVEHLAQAERLYEQGRNSDGVAASRYNRGVAEALAGRYQEAVDLLGAVAHTPFLGISWQISRSTLPGVASFALAVDPPGLPLVVRDADGGWLRVPSGPLAPPRATVQIPRAGAAVSLDLERTREAGLVAALLEPRREATTPAALALDLTHLPVLVAHLAHIHGLLLPLALGDTCLALGDTERAETYYRKARDYRFLNREFERPVVWQRLAATYLQRGRDSYLDGDAQAARVALRQIIPPRPLIGAWSASPLYAGPFADMARDARAFLDASDPIAFTDLDTASRLLLLDAAAHLHRLERGIDRIGLAEWAPVAEDWTTLRERAGALAREAGLVAAGAREVARAVERGEWTRATLEQAVNVLEAALRAEELRVRNAEDLRAAAAQSAATAHARLASTRQEAESLDGGGARVAKLSAMNRWASVPPLPTSSLRQALPRAVASHRASRGEEQASLREQAGWIASASAEAARQAEAASWLVEDATNQARLARLRLEQARSALRAFDGQAGGREQASAASRILHEVSVRCAETAIGALEQVEAATLLRHGLDSDRPGPGSSPRQARLANRERLPEELARISAAPAPGTDLRIPLRAAISLAERWPHLFARQFWETGRLEFETLLTDIDTLCPGAWLATLRHVDVELETEEEIARCHATLTRSGIAAWRDQEGAARVLVHAPRRLTIANYRGPGAPLSLTPSDAFAGLPAAGSWVFALSPETGHLDPRRVVDVRLALDIDARHDDRLALLTHAATEHAIAEHALAFSARASYPHDFSLMRTTGAVSFAIDPSGLPDAHADPRLVDAVIRIDTGSHSLPPGLILSVGTPEGIVIDGAIDGDGVIGTDDGAAPLNALRGQPLLDRWTLRLDRARNRAHFADGFRWEAIRDIHLLIDYAYQSPGALPAAAPSRWQRMRSAAPSFNRA